MSQLQLSTVTVGQPITPIQSNGTWEVFVVTSQTPIPLDQATASIRQILTQTTANHQRVSKEVLAFARTSSVDVNPQYGTWAGTGVKPPTPPPTRYLLPFYGSTISTTTTTTAPPNTSGSTTTTTHHHDEPDRLGRGLSAPVPDAPRIDVVGLGPAGPDLITAGTLEYWPRPTRSSFAPAATRPPSRSPGPPRSITATSRPRPSRTSTGRSWTTSSEPRPPAVRWPTRVPGSPNVAERTVALLALHPRVVSGEITVAVHPSVSFLDLAFARLGVDPVDAGVRLVDAERFAIEAAGERGPLLVAQCWSRQVLSDMKLSVESAPSVPVTVLHHLGLPDESVVEVGGATSTGPSSPTTSRRCGSRNWRPRWLPSWCGLDELVHTLRERCPWDQRQTHASLGRHLLEESYEVLEAIDALAAVDAAPTRGDGTGGRAATSR